MTKIDFAKDEVPVKITSCPENPCKKDCRFYDNCIARQHKKGGT